MRKAALIMALALAGALGFMGAAKAQNNILFIFDASNSMWGQIDGVAKIETARDALNEALGGLDDGINVGLMAFGHRRSGDCDDIEILADIGAAPPAKLRKAVDGITPRGRTPLAGSLEASWEALAGFEEDFNTVVLISDGIETCGGEPCAVAAGLTQKGIDVRVHAVGFDVDEDAEQQLICVAEAGGGEYFRAEDGSALRVAMAEVRKQVAQAEPRREPEAAPEPQTDVYFRDDFSGTVLDERWEVVNPNPDFFIVEGGELLVVNDGVYGFRQDDTPNLIRLDHPLPDGDWDLIFRLTAEFKTGHDNIWIGLHTDSDNFMGVHLFVDGRSAFDAGIVDLVRRSGGDESTTRRVFAGRGEDTYRDLVRQVETEGLVLTLKKRGRTYGGSIEIDGQTHETETLTSLRLPGRYPAVAVGQNRSASGETVILVDSVEIVRVSD